MNGKRIYLVYFILLELITIFPDYASLISVGIIVFNLLTGFIWREKIDIAILFSFLLPGEVFPLINLLMLLLFKMNEDVSISSFRVKKINLFTFLFVVCCSSINAIQNNTGINLLFYLAYLVIIMFTVVLSYNRLNVEILTASIKQFILIEFAVTVTIVLKYRTMTPGDIFHGSMSSAHWFGNWLIVTLILLSFHNSSKSKTKFSLSALKQNKWYILVTMIMLYLADAKSLLAALAIGILGYLIFEHKRIAKYSFLIYMLSFYMGVFLIMSILYSAPVKKYIQSNSEFIATYLYLDGWNGKFSYIKGTFVDELSGIRFFTGYGLGQYGSRVANLFAYDVMWRADNTINNLIAATFSPHHISEYIKYIEYYDDYFVSQIQWRSAVLSYPFNSFTALFAETGIIGVILSACVINSYSRKSYCRIMVYYFLAATFFDIYFDNYPCVALIIVILVNTTLASNKKLSDEGKL